MGLGDGAAGNPRGKGCSAPLSLGIWDGKSSQVVPDHLRMAFAAGALEDVLTSHARDRLRR